MWISQTTPSASTAVADIFEQLLRELKVKHSAKYYAVASTGMEAKI